MGLRECFTPQKKKAKSGLFVWAPVQQRQGPPAAVHEIRIAAGIHVSIANRPIMHPRMNVLSIFEYRFMRQNIEIVLCKSISLLQDLHICGYTNVVSMRLSTRVSICMKLHYVDPQSSVAHQLYRLPCNQIIVSIMLSRYLPRHDVADS